MITSYVGGYITSLAERPGQVFNERSRVQTSARRPAILTWGFPWFPPFLEVSEGIVP
jgi:hypothetical protein